jgi:hypothetical protein
MARRRCAFCARAASNTFQLLPGRDPLAICAWHLVFLYLGLDKDWTD